MAPPHIAPKNQERQFRFSELFFSTTDKKGIIRYGNEIFSRIAGYPLESLIGQPHNIIRHPDMPKSAFQLLWDYLRQDKLVAAYVKNLAKDGCYYWVMALVMPCDDGYLSIRLKPSSDFFPAVQQVYQEMLETEQRVETEARFRQEAIKAGTDVLVGRLKELGFSSYDEFMWAAFAAEMSSRAANSHATPPDVGLELNSDPDRIDTPDQIKDDKLSNLFVQCKALDKQLKDLFSRLDTFSRLGDELIPKSQFILQLGEAIRLLSLNAAVECARLGDLGAALGVVAEWMGRHTTESSQTISKLNTQLDRLTSPISQLVFNTLVSKLKIEMASTFIEEILRHHQQTSEHDAVQDAQLYENVKLLSKVFLETAREILPAIDYLKNNLGAINEEVANLHHFTQTLHFIQFTGKVETARSTAGDAFVNIFSQLRQQIHDAESELSEFLQLIVANIDQVAMLKDFDNHLFSEFEKWADAA